MVYRKLCLTKSCKNWFKKSLDEDTKMTLDYVDEVCQKYSYHTSLNQLAYLCLKVENLSLGLKNSNNN